MVLTLALMWLLLRCECAGAMLATRQCYGGGGGGGGGGGWQPPKKGGLYDGPDDEQEEDDEEEDIQNNTDYEHLQPLRWCSWCGKKQYLWKGMCSNKACHKLRVSQSICCLINVKKISYQQE